MAKEHHASCGCGLAKQKEGFINRRALWTLAGLALLAFGLQPQGEARAASFITFDVPGSTCLPRFPRCTRPVAINQEGTITGFYADANGALHGFLRTRSGTFTKFDPPGAGCPSFRSFCTLPTGINPAGAIVGDSSAGGFLRAPDGTFTMINPPGAAFTSPVAINPAGAITGYYYDENFDVGHGFVRANNGTFTVFDLPGSLLTAPAAINPDGTITGTYYDENFVPHGFVRSNGTLTTFDCPGTTGNTLPTAINPAKAIVGDCETGGFLRSPDGTFTTIAFPAAMAAIARGTKPAAAIRKYFQQARELQGLKAAAKVLLAPLSPLDVISTSVSAINPGGVIAGAYQAVPASGVFQHGFVRTRNGIFTSFDPLDSIFTQVSGINPGGVITGSYIDAGFLEHGYLRIP
ncbi:MAG: hypothetical protein L0Y50_01515 [Beijerinckiaceae bacterium]|nr:hypothetical protein [Beijerinckiaceae bacterium]MCI0734951.1 hypothetical protein [Beijerinckiaceae bacterium]